MKDNLINFKQSIEYYLDLSDKSMDEGKPLLALNSLRHAKKQATKLEDLEEILLCQAQIYADMGRFYNSNDALFELLAKNTALSDCYFGLAQNYYCLDQEELSNYYFEKLSELEPEIPTDEISDYLDIPNTYFHDSAYRVVYPTTSEDADRAKDLIQRGEIDKAIDILTQVPKGCSNYVDAMNDLSLCYMVKEQYDKSLAITDEILKDNPNNVLAICNQMIVYKIAQKEVDVDGAIEKFASNKEMSTFEKTKVATTMCEFRRHNEAVKYFEEVLEERPYVEAFMILLGIAYFNAKRFDESLDIFVKMLKVDPQNGVAKYYIRFVKEYIEKVKSGKAKTGRAKFEELMYLPQLPLGEILRRSKWLANYFEGDMLEMDDENSYESEQFDWLFSTNQVNLQIAAIYALTCSDVVRKVDIMERLLLNDDVEKQVKSFTIESLVELNAKKISLTIDGKFVQEKVKRPKDFKLMPQVVRLAFDKVYAVLIFFKADKLPKISEQIKWANQYIIDNKLDIRSYEALASIVMFKLGMVAMFPEDILLDVLEANEKTYKKYKKQFKL
ncbi:MAG: hypothetical protein RR458_02140 [Clostridia bacterium]